MNRSVRSDSLRLTFLLLMSSALITAAAQAQGRFGLQAPAVLRPGPIALQSGPPAQQQAPKPGTSIALADPGPIGLATSTNLFAQVAIGGGYTTVFSFVNSGVDTTIGDLILTDDQGQPLVATLTSTTVNSFVSSTPILVPPGGTQLVTASPSNTSDPVTNGWARVESTGGSLGGVATFKLVNNNVLTTIVGVLSAATTSSATIPVNDDGTLGAKKRYTGYAVANPGSSNINVKIVLVNPDGTVLQTVTPPPLNPLAPGHHFVRFLFENLGNPNLKFTGSMVMIETAGNPFSVVALTLEEGLLTAIPVTPGKAPGIN